MIQSLTHKASDLSQPTAVTM